MKVLQTARSRALHVSQLLGVALAASPLAALAQTATPEEAAFTSIGEKITTVSGLAFGVAVIGVLAWTGIKLFRKGATKAGGAS